MERNDIITTSEGYRDVAVQTGIVFATNRASPHRVHVYDSSTWRRLREIPVPCCSAEPYSLHTLHALDDRILLCCFTKEKLYLLSHSGELLQTHGRSRREATADDIIGQTAFGKPMYRAGILSGPRLCQVDAGGSALVADRFHPRLQLMRSDGKWTILDLTFGPEMGGIEYAIWCGETLYVVSTIGKVNFLMF